MKRNKLCNFIESKFWHIRRNLFILLLILLSWTPAKVFASEGFNQWDGTYGEKLDLNTWKDNNPGPWRNYYNTTSTDCASRWYISLGPLGLTTLMHDRSWGVFPSCDAIFPAYLKDENGLVAHCFEVLNAKSDGPADGLIQDGDLILKIDGVKLKAAQCTMLGVDLGNRDVRGLEMHAGELIDAAEGVGSCTLTVLRVPEEDKAGLVNACAGLRSWSNVGTVNLIDDTENSIDIDLGSCDILKISVGTTSGLTANNLVLDNGSGLLVPLSNSNKGGTKFFNQHFEIPEGSWRLKGSIYNSKADQVATFEVMNAEDLPAVFDQYIHDVEIALPKIGSFGHNFDPTGEKARNYSAIIARRLAMQQEEDGSWVAGGYASNAFHTSVCGLGLLSTDDPQYAETIKKAAYFVAEFSSKDKWTYSRAMWIEFLSEYYLRTGDQAVLDGLKGHIADARKHILADYTAGHSTDPGYGGSGYIGGGGMMACAFATASYTPAMSDDDKFVLDKMLERVQQIAPQGKVPYGRGNKSRDIEVSSINQSGSCGTGPYFSAALVRGGATHFSENAKLRYGQSPWGTAENGHATQTIHFFWGMIASANCGSDAHIGSMNAYLWKFTTLREFDGFINKNNYRVEYHSGDGVVGEPYWRTGAYLTIMNAYKKNLAITGKSEFIASQRRTTDVVLHQDISLWKLIKRNWTLLEAALENQTPQSLTDGLKALDALPHNLDLGVNVRNFVQATAPQIATDILALESIPAGNNKVQLAELAIGTSFEAYCDPYDDGDEATSLYQLTVNPIAMIQSDVEENWLVTDFTTGLFTFSNISATVTDPSRIYLSSPFTVQFSQHNGESEEILNSTLSHIFTLPEGVETSFDVQVSYTVGGVAINYTVPMPIPNLTARSYNPNLTRVKVAGTSAEDYSGVWTTRLKLASGKYLDCEQWYSPISYILAGTPCEFVISPTGGWAHNLRQVTKLDGDYGYAKADTISFEQGDFVGEEVALFDGDVDSVVTYSTSTTDSVILTYNDAVEVSALVAESSNSKNNHLEIDVEVWQDGVWKMIRRTCVNGVNPFFTPITGSKFRLTLNVQSGITVINDISLRHYANGEAEKESFAPVFSDVNLADLFCYENTSLTIDVAGFASDIDGDALSFAKNSGPDFVTVSENGTVVVNPLSGDAGEYEITVKVYDGIDGCDLTTFSVEIKANQPFLHWTFNDGTASDISGNSNDGTVYGAVSVIDGDGGAFSFDGVDDSIVKTLTESTWPEFTVSLWVKAAVTGQDNYSSVFNNNGSGSDFQIDVNGLNPGSYLYRGSESVVLSDVTTDWIHFTAACDGTETKLYKNGVYVATTSAVNNVFGQIAVGVNRNGKKGFEGLIDELIVYDRVLSESEVAGLFDADAMNLAPVAVNDNVITDENQEVVVAVLDNDSDPDGDVLTVVETTHGSHGYVRIESGEVIYSPVANWSGNDTFTYTVSDGELLATAVVTVTVNVVNSTPVAVDDNITINEDEVTILDLCGNDEDSDLYDKHVVTEITPATFGVVELIGTNVIYTPPVDGSGIAYFSYTMSDGFASATANVTVNVAAVNDLPVVVNEAVVTDEDTALVVNVLDNDSDIESAVLTVSAVTDGTFGTVTTDGTTVTYTPNLNAHGNDSFTYSVSDEDGGTVTGSVNVTVNSVLDATFVLDDSVNVGVGIPVEIAVLTNDWHPEGLSFSLTSATQPNNGTVTIVGDVLTYISNAEFTGEDSFSYQVTDENLATSQAVVTVNVMADFLIFEDFDTVNTINSARDITAISPYTVNMVSVGQGNEGDVKVVDSGNTGQLGSTTIPVNQGNSSFSINENCLQITAPTSYTDDSVNDPWSDNLTMNLANSGAVFNFGDNADVTLKDISFDYQKISAKYYRILVRYTTDNGLTWQNVDRNGDGSEDSNDVIIRNVTNGSEKVQHYTIANPVALQGVDAVRVLTWSSTSDYAQVILVDNVMIDVDFSPGTKEDILNISEDLASSVSVLTNDYDLDGNSLSIDSVSQGSNGTVTTDGSTVIYTPSADWFGNDSFTYTVTDGELTATETVSVTVNAVNDAPVSVADSAITDEDNAVVIAVLANDSDVDSSISIDSVSQGANGSVATNGSTVTYTPSADWSGNDSFIYTVTDGELSATETVSVTVNAVNDAPVVVDDLVTVDENDSVVINVLDNDSDIDLDTLTIESVTQGSNGSVSFDATTVTYAPVTGFSGEDSFTCTVTDGTESVTATVSITVNDVWTTVPNVVGTGQATAEANIVTAQLIVGTISELNDEVVPAGDVISQSLTAGTSVALNSTVDLLISLGPSIPMPKLYSTVVPSVGTDQWIRVNTPETYDSMVVVATPRIVDTTNVSMVTRIANVTASSFDIIVQRIDDGTGTFTAVDVDVMVAEEGVYTVAECGVNMEVGKHLSTTTTYKNNYNIDQITPVNTYTTPVVLGQVMSFNDSRWSMFWACDGNRQNVPSASSIYIGKAVGEDPDYVRNDETLGYIIIESGVHTVEEVTFEVGVGSDSVQGFDDAPGFNYNLSGSLSSASAAILSANAFDGADQGTPVLYGLTPVSYDTLTLVFAEDTKSDTERKHTAEQAAYIVFE